MDSAFIFLPDYFRPKNMDSFYMQANSFLNNLNVKATVTSIFGPIQLLQESIDALFLSYFQVIIETVASLTEKLKGRPTIIMRKTGSLTGCYVARRLYGQ